MKIREQYPLFLAQCVILKPLWVKGPGGLPGGGGIGPSVSYVAGICEVKQVGEKGTLEEGAGFPLYARSLCAAAEESCTQTW